MLPFENKFSINCKGVLLDLNVPKVMGILNTSSQSFYQIGDVDLQSLIERTGKMIEEGADIIDVGGMSTRPGSEEIPLRQELENVTEVIREIKKKHPNALVSIDTYHSQVAKAAVKAGADIINDISAGLFDADMLSTVADLEVPYIAMHTQGKPQFMQHNPQYENVTKEILSFFIQRIDLMRKAGIKDIVIDVGFGFGKTLEHNYQLLKELHVFQLLSCPILIGVSRKSMIYKLLHISPEEALNGTSVVHTLALQQGVNILRVHDVKAAKESIDILQFYNHQI